MSKIILIILDGEKPAVVNDVTIGREDSSAIYEGSVLIIFTILFVFFICFSTIMGKLPAMALALYLVASIITFVVYALDKSAARNDRWRARERTLHLLGLLGGWPGAMVAQKVLRHKSRKQSFQVLTFAAVTVNCLALVWFLVT